MDLCGVGMDTGCTLDHFRGVCGVLRLEKIRIAGISRIFKNSESGARQWYSVGFSGEWDLQTCATSAILGNALICHRVFSAFSNGVFRGVFD